MTGLVSLVGAGPGDPELLTLKALRRLGEADLVLYDALVAPEVLALAGRAHRFFVGKRAGRKSVRQETIHRLMIRAARKGQRVVRLKCGDPVVLGRGGEEALALAAAGVPFELVPGVSSAIAAAELSGIPLTHRGLASGFVVVSGHAPSAYEPILGSLVPHSATVVVLMGVASRAQLARFLLARGWRKDAPAALSWAASTPHARRWLGRLDQLAEHDADRADDAPADDPGTLVVGDVVGLAERIGGAPAAEEPMRAPATSVR